jgi:hypothetical protein
MLRNTPMNKDNSTRIDIKKLPKVSKLKLLKDICFEPDHKPVHQMIKEIIILSFMNRKFPPRYYFSRYLYKKDRENIRDFFPDEFYAKINNEFNDGHARSVLENKLYFHFFYSQFNVPVPELLAYNHLNMFVAGEKVSEINSSSDFRLFLATLADGIPDNGSIFLKRTWGTYGGDHVYKLNKNQIHEDENYISELYREISSSGYIFQKKIKQHPALDSLNSSCINTIRTDTFIDKEGNAEIMSAYLRTSFTGLHVDNITSGGCSIPIDTESGKLKKLGFMKPGRYGVRQPYFHPVTKTVFENYSIPYFKDVKTLVCRTAKYIPQLRLVGWDVAISETGPVIVEGNSFYEISGCDLTYGGYRKNPVFRKALLEKGYIQS